MQLRLVLICAVFIALGAVIIYFTQPATPDSATDPAPAPVRTAEPAAAAPETDTERAAAQQVTDSAVEIPESGGFRVHGRVLDAETREPLPAAVIFVPEPGEELPDSTVANSAGAYDIRVRPDQARIHSRAEGYAMARISLPSRLQEDYPLDILLERGASIMGKVVERGTNLPIEDIIVQAVSAGDGAWVTMSRQLPQESARMAQDATDDQGQFFVTGLEAGTYRVIVQARDAGFLFSSDQAEVIPLNAGELAEGVYFELERGAVVVGSVRGPDGQPIPGARVRAVPKDAISAALRGLETQDTEVLRPLAAESDDEGRFELPGLSFETEYRLMGAADGFATNSSQPFAIPRSQRRASVDLRLTIGSIIAGALLLEDGSPLPDQRLMLMPTGETMAASAFAPDAMANNMVRTDEEGAFSLAHIPAGSYVLNFTDRSFRLVEPYPITVDGTSLYDGVKLLAQETGRPSFGEGVITGLVLDTGGRPAPGVTVSARPAFIARGVATAITEPDGRFVLETPPGRRFDVIARTDYGRAILEAVAIGDDVVLQLRPPARVSGIVIDSRNLPVPEAEVRLERVTSRTPEDPAEEIMVAVGGMMGPGDGAQRTELNGHFLFPEVDPGEYTIHAKSQTLGAGESHTFVVYEGQDLSNVQVRLEAGVIFGGRVQDASGQPVSGAFIRLTPVGPGGEIQQMMANFMPMGAGLDAVTTASQRDGRFEIANVIPGEYMLEATHARFAKTIQRGIRVSRGADVRSHLVVMSEGGGARGRYAPGGQAQAGAMILVVGESGMQMATTAFDGTFELDNLTSGEYMMFPMRFDATDPADFLDLWNSAQVVDIADGGITDIDFTPPAGGQPVTGTSNAAPDTITVVSLRRPGGPDPATINPLNMLEAMRAMRHQVAVGMANPDGSFSFDNIPPGTYILDAVTLDASIMTNPDPSLLFNLDQFPRITQNVTVGSGPLNLNLEF